MIHDHIIVDKNYIQGKQSLFEHVVVGHGHDLDMRLLTVVPLLSTILMPHLLGTP